MDPVGVRVITFDISSGGTALGVSKSFWGMGAVDNSQLIWRSNCMSVGVDEIISNLAMCR